MRIAYLTNRYPAVSHSFIRREILGIEALGTAVTRVTIRPAAPDLPDEQDQAERRVTACILDQGILALLWTAMRLAVAHPVRAGKGLRVALKMAGLDPRRVVRHLAYFVEATWLAKYLGKEGVEHLHAHFGTNPAAVARILHHVSGLPYSFTAHGPTEFDSPVALDLAGKIADARAAIGISSFGRSQLMRWSSPAHWHKIFVVRCGLDDSFFEASIELPPPEPRLCSVARLTAQKGFPLLIEACALLKSRGTRFTFTLVGDGELRAQLERQVLTLGLQRDVLFAGACGAAEVRDHIVRSRALVLPSFAEGLPVALMEALALARPVITTRIAGIPELIDDQCGWLIRAGSVEDLADAMEAALGAPEERLAQMGAIGRQRVRAMHSAGNNAAELLRLLEAGKAGSP